MNGRLRTRSNAGAQVVASAVWPHETKRGPTDMNTLSKLLTAAAAVALLATPLASAAQSFHHGGYRGGPVGRGGGWRGGPGWRGPVGRGWGWQGAWGPGVYGYPGPVVYGYPGPVAYEGPPEAPYYDGPPPPATIVYERSAPAPRLVRVHHYVVRHATHHIACVAPTHPATHHA
jgi:hypothetical protein